jgi:hypothetical protein
MRSWRSVFSMVAIAIAAGLTWSAAATAQTGFKITASDAAANDYFGHSVSIDGDYAIAGACDHGVSLNDGGSAYIFKRDGTSWTQQD